MIDEAVNSLRQGDPVIVYDREGREEEADIFFAAERITPSDIRLMRTKGGGLICVSLHHKIARIFGLPYLRDLLSKKVNGPIRHLVRKKLPYDTRSTFSITVNHVDTYTGITDRDRALTISQLGKLCSKIWKEQLTKREGRESFIQAFRAPGHVFLLRGTKNLLVERTGHTELSLALALLGEFTPCIALVEMLGDNGKALSLNAAKQFAKDKGYFFLKGEKIIESYSKEW
ncbi:MAG: 3,4-dihydroxy-2-butanone-4-phosphate synthase [Candidatus Korarchaeota archaeon]|nr:3,4-dihydroxy-2-butanone-4-phosphate synthase [Candidatus Korarchaeota archaeon]NIU83139.1 3,4-dihydroxy-2-butanone-4-phosphate synthase [Candidatus Thorarchaeota archaeon]NIW13513.1 3,4-dihydroxy-2-butanone-4-phosphate synthase [Candidatus Thorarchaeota archaeon]NIW51611.1 3,4-dihydroxy-2-butanone-4-phosphate synthase [Candidatus Korarchaeota archaeon]